ncbi:nucleotidyltransferase domain-containing protein [Paenibacillus alba]|uniref:Nucleotidyltransferase domain-containing protein n=1 Tax=Paenibacillus alba TaxID=1197127 RepID=A0ABU6GC95_9BACL|nr:nucleotidyltransferase domain-containing protein [Paenibacillus alba]MEC0231761.1 nucleotidyltransferase domain-containing protein [Paenibacillus alba]
MAANDVIATAVEQLRHIPGVKAIVLGGSRARGTETAESDIDLGLYYQPDQPIDMHALDLIATSLDDERRKGLITPTGEWGPWINGGGWLKSGGLPLDILYRDVARVSSVIDDCSRGHLDIHYQPGHPHGFCTSIYMGEVASCKLLWDPDGLVLAMKQLTDPYPAALRQATISKFMWEADFSIANAKKARSRSDVSYAAGHLFRTVSCLVQVLFACNGVYLLNEKGAVAQCGQFSAAPANFEQRVREGFACLSAERAGMTEAVRIFESLVRETEAFAS